MKNIRKTFSLLVWILILFSTLSLVAATVFADQLSSTGDAGYYLQMAEDKMNEALASYEDHYPGKNLWAEAINYGEIVIELDPDSAEAHYLLAKIYQHTNWYYREAREWERYVQLIENQQALSPEIKRNYSYAHYRLGYAAYQKNEIDLAIDYLQEATRIKSDMVEPHYWLGRLYYENDNLEASYDSWQKVLSIDPDYQRAVYFLRKTEGALQYGKQAYEYYEAGYNFYEKKLYQKALSEYQQAISYNNKFTDAHYWLGRIHYELANYQQAADYWSQVLRMDPGNDKAAYWQKQAEKHL